jgi:hypothetical protein
VVAYGRRTVCGNTRGASESAAVTEGKRLDPGVRRASRLRVNVERGAPDCESSRLRESIARGTLKCARQLWASVAQGRERWPTAYCQSESLCD